MGERSGWVLKERKRTVITKPGPWLLIRVILFDNQTLITIEDDDSESFIRFDGYHKYILNYIQNVEIYDEVEFFVNVLFLCDIIPSTDVREVTKLTDRGLVEIVVE